MTLTVVMRRAKFSSARWADQILQTVPPKNIVVQMNDLQSTHIKAVKTKYLFSFYNFVFKDNFLTQHLLFAYITELPSYFRNGTHIQMVFH